MTFPKFAPPDVRNDILGMQVVEAIDLYEEARLADVTRRSLFEVDGIHRKAFAVMDCVSARGPGHLKVLFDVRRSRDAEEFCGGLCCRDVSENSYQRAFLVRSEPLDGCRESGVFDVWGWQSSGGLACPKDWSFVCKADIPGTIDEEAGLLPFVIKPPSRDRDRHPQMAGRVNCLKQLTNYALDEFEKRCLSLDYLSA